MLKLSAREIEWESTKVIASIINHLGLQSGAGVDCMSWILEDLGPWFQWESRLRSETVSWPYKEDPAAEWIRRFSCRTMIKFPHLKQDTVYPRCVESLSGRGSSALIAKEVGHMIASYSALICDPR